jgi:hypothetical protein
MKKLAPVMILLASLTFAYGASAATTAPTDAELKACFQAHATLMEKPALKNLVTCWHAHGYLMSRS